MPNLAPSQSVPAPAAPSPAVARPRWSTAADWICALAVGALWLITRPYRGVRHDATLYAGEALARLLPDRVGQDLFFVYGSQDKYSVFSPLMAPLFARFGVGVSELVVLVLCNLLFALACWQLMRPWFPRPMRWVALLFVAAMPHTYGGQGVVSYAESFLTARSIAEPLALFALAQYLRGRLAAAGSFALLAALFHPLIILTVIVVGWFELVARRRQALWLAALLLVPMGLGGLGLHPFDGLFRRYDDAWYDAILGPNTLVFAASHDVLDWSALVFDVLVLLLCVSIESTGAALARLMKAALAAAALATVLWVLGADVLRDVLLTQLQVWRIYWIVHLLAIMGLPLLGLHYWRRGWTGRWCLAALALAGVAIVSNWPTGWLCLVWAGLCVAVDRADAKVSASIAIAAAAGSVLMLLGISAKVTHDTLQATEAFPDRFAHVGPLMIVLGLPVAVAVLSIAIVWLARQGGRRAALAAVVVLAGAVFGVGAWDQRSPWELRLEAGAEAGPPAFEDAMPAHAVVYWDGDLRTPWLLAGRGNYFSFYQGAGLLFNRATAIEFARRAKVVAPIELRRQLCSALSALKPGAVPEGACGIAREDVATVCLGDPRLDYLVFDTPVSTVPVAATWHEAPAGAGGDAHAFYLYACASLR